MPQLQINQGPQDALLYDNTRSYFTNVGYVRTSNFQVEYRDVDPQNGKSFGSTMQFVIPKAADLLGPVDLMVDLKAPSATDHGLTGGNEQRTWAQWVDEVGFAMIEKCTFSIGSNDIETITGEQMQIKNELMTSDEQRLGYAHVLKTGKPAFVHKNHAAITAANATRPGERPGRRPDRLGRTGALRSGTLLASGGRRVTRAMGVRSKGGGHPGRPRPTPRTPGALRSGGLPR